MPDSPLLPLTTASAFSGGEAFYTVQGGNDRKALSSQFYQYITTVSTFATGAGFPLTAVSDTNVNLNLAGLSSAALLQAVSITAAWAGTLSSDRLNANVVQTVTNDSNVTGAISSQNLALGWTGVLPSSRIGTVGSSQVTGLPSLGPFNSSQVVFANSSNTVTGNDVFTWNNTANRLTVGASTPITIDFTQSALQVVSSGVSNWGQSWLQYNSVLGGGVELAFAHSRSSTAYGVTALTSTDNMLQFRVYGTDGTTYVPSARLEANVDDTVSANIVPSRWAFYTQPTTGGSILERIRIDSAGHVVVGGSSAIAINTTGFNINANYQQHGTTQNTAAAVQARWSNDGSCSVINFAKSRGTTISSQAIVRVNDTTSVIRTFGSDGTDFRNMAAIQVVVDATPGLNDVPSRFEFYTRLSGATNSAEHYRIDNAGNVWIMNAATPGITPTGATASVNGVAAEYTHAAYGGV